MRGVGLVSLRHLTQQKGRTLLNLIGVALGVGVFTAISFLNRSAAGAFQQAIDDMAGKAQVQIVAGAGGMSATTWDDVRPVPAVKAGSPLVMGMAVLPEQPADPVMVYGVEYALDEEIRDYSLSTGELPAKSDEALLGSAAAALLHAKVGDRVQLAVPAGLRDVRVSGVLAENGAGRINSGMVLIVPIEKSREMFLRENSLDAIDVVAEDGANISTLIDYLKEILPGGVTVQRTASRSNQVESLLASFTLMLQIMGGSSLFLGMFVIYNSMSVAVAQRRTEIGMLRILGLNRSAVRNLFLLESALTGLVGSGMGLLLGWGLALGSLSTMSGAVSAAYTQIAIDRLVAMPLDLVKGVLLGTLTASVAGVIPAVSASRIDPMETVRNKLPAIQDRRWLVRGLYGFIALVLAFGLGVAQKTLGNLELGFGALAVGLLGVVLMLPVVISIAGPGLRTLLKVLGRDAQLIADRFRLRPVRTAVTVGAVIGGVTLAVGMATMIGSMKGSIENWVQQMIGGDIMVTASPVLGEGPLVLMDEALADEIRQAPGVEGVFSTRYLPLDYAGHRIMLYAHDVAIMRRYSPMVFVDGEANAAFDELEKQGSVAISTTLARRERLKPGDSMRLTTGQGDQTFRVAATYLDYSSDRGSIMIDRNTYKRFWGDSRISTLSIAVDKAHEADVVLRDLLDRYQGKRPFQAQLNSTFRHESLQRIDQVFQITGLLEFVAVLVGMLAVFSTVMISVIEQVRDFGMLRAMGLLRRQITKLVLIEAGLIGLAGGALGLITGLAMGKVALVTMEQTFGTRISFQVPTAEAISILLVVTAMSILAGVGPALNANRLDIVRAINDE